MAQDDTRHDRDNEYGPTPAGAQYEHTDIDPSMGYRFAVWLALAMLVSVGVVYGAFWAFEGQREARDAAAQQFPLAAGVEKDPPLPRLQTQPFKDIYQLREGENERLETYGWVDKEGGIVRMPIERAMELVVERAMPARAGSANDVGRITMDSSAGRTTGVR
jgi:hypothetical protein